MQVGFLKFEEQYMDRIWGGTQLRRVLGKAVPEDRVIGESWVISDHATCQSVVCEGPQAGRTLHELMEADPGGILGTHAAMTPDGRFPLLLKIIDAEEDLSVQVHPDDEQARQLGEPDVGKTEMWYVLDTDRECMITLGLQHGVTRDLFEQRLREGEVADLLGHFPVSGGEAVFVAAGSIHAIGAGALLAEIQQNSNITYRLFDYNRRDAQGKLRELHIEKGLAVTRFEGSGGGRIAPLRYTESGVTRECLSACRYFAAEKVQPVDGRASGKTGGSFHILLCLEQSLVLEGDCAACELRRGEAALVPASVPEWRVVGQGAFMEYYVPDLHADVIAPLRRHGYADCQIALLGGASGDADLRRMLQG